MKEQGWLIKIVKKNTRFRFGKDLSNKHLVRFSDERTAIFQPIVQAFHSAEDPGLIIWDILRFKFDTFGTERFQRAGGDFIKGGSRKEEFLFTR